MPHFAVSHLGLHFRDAFNEYCTNDIKPLCGFCVGSLFCGLVLCVFPSLATMLAEEERDGCSTVKLPPKNRQIKDLNDKW